MKSLLFSGGLMALIALSWASWAMAQCDCYCVDGALRTLCTGLEEAQAGDNLCAGRDLGTCPASLDPLAPQSYAAPADGAENCRDARVWNVEASSYVTLKICDAIDAG